jgi:hypothetical protein
MSFEGKNMKRGREKGKRYRKRKKWKRKRENVK